MSTIERMADLLGQIAQGKIEKSDPGSVSPDKLDAIERAANVRAKDFHSIETGDFLAQPEARILTSESKSGINRERLAAETPATFRTNRVPTILNTGKTASIVSIDRDHLRRQGLIQPDGERTPVAECFRLIKSQLLTNLAKFEANSGANIIMVTSALAGEGKTFCATNLAISISQERDRSVLLVDADVVRPSVLQRLGIKADRGLMDVLLDQSIDLSDVICQTDIGKLTVLPSGSVHPHSTELLASDRMRMLVSELAERYDDRVVIFDSPPLLAASEAAALAAQMAQIVVVVEAGKTTESDLKAALDRVDSSKIAGLLLNKGESRGSGYYGGYGTQ